MQDDFFEWGDDKARLNFAKHRVTFEIARNAFLDMQSLDEFDHTDALGEDRFNWYGMVGGYVLVVTYTMRQNRRRIISARKATKHEQDAYFTRQV